MRLLLKIAAVGTGVSLFFTYLVFARPVARDHIKHADAVVVLGVDPDDDSGTEVDAGLHLMHSGVAPLFILIEGKSPGRSTANRVCSTRHRFAVECPTPVRGGIEGTARVISRMVRAHHWKHIVIVTQSYDMRRARLLVKRCARSFVYAYSAEESIWSFGRWWGSFTEWGKLAHAEIWRQC